MWICSKCGLKKELFHKWINQEKQEREQVKENLEKDLEEGIKKVIEEERIEKIKD